ncbi:ThiF family adenylyltransferase [Anaeromyxobacter diazotrophicus]|uniref:Thiamine biosynthesis protein ThiF n=1 Tax=Anaeromyxobacter diazotrophicus TaxID=2590199 RepID=A0A7I9VHS0_9BACT|nr:ThiF family adenylyltransferase [Anaeromyxobacter diazotrophicus]GEJ55953.1 thiamine biosynthesis protein ThiF [Anaeromyxobacter diazotrophicus]
MVTLTILEPQLDELLAAIFAEQPNEGAAFLICGTSHTEREDRLLVREVVPVERAHYLVREPQRLSIDSQAYANAAKRAEADGSSVVFVHSHPGGVGEFSPQDDHEEPKLMTFLDARVPGRLHGSLVIASRSDLRGRVWGRGRWTDIARIRVLGGRFRFHDQVGEARPLPEFYDRQVRAFGEDVQRLLHALHVGVVGAGGTGSAVAEQLARLGVGELSIFDGDTLTATNVTRVYGSTVAATGMNKAELARAHLAAIGLRTKVTAIPAYIDEEAVAKRLRDCDIVFGCTDKATPRSLLVALATRYYIPTFDVAVKIDSADGVLRGIFGRVTTLMPGEACLFCRGRITAAAIALEALDPVERRARAAERYAPELEENDPAVITFTTAVAAQGVTEMLHRLTGFMGEERRSTEVLLRFQDSLVSRNRQPPAPDCICMRKALWGRGDGRDFLGVVWAK